MSGFNKVTSFVLGLIVVLVFLFVFGSRVNITDKLVAFRSNKVTPTVTTTPSPTPVRVTTPTPTSKKGFFESLFSKKPTPTPTTNPRVTPTTVVYMPSDGSTGPVSNIPNTGSPTLLLPILISALGSGIYLRKRN